MARVHRDGVAVSRVVEVDGETATAYQLKVLSFVEECVVAREKQLPGR
ncbi:hypothetical protein ABZ863_09895 [Saccharomonospora sp. NPDC046836]